MQGQGHSKSRGQGKVKLKFFGLGGVIHVFGLVFVENTEITIEHFLNGPSRTNFENRENTDIAGNRVKNGLFRSSKHQNSANFQMHEIL